MSRHASARGALAGLALGLAAVVVGPLAVPSLVVPAAAAAPDLTVVSSTRYDVQPTHQRIHVTVDLQATNHRTDTVVRSYFFDHVVLGFLPDAGGFKAVPATGSKAKPTVHVASRNATRTLVSVGFGTKLHSGKTLAMRVSFDLVDHGGAPDRAVRVGSAIATFPVWAVGTPDTPGSKVRVTVPADYRVEVLGGPMTGPTTGPSGTKVYTSASLSAPKVFGAYILADRPGAYRETPVNVTVGGRPFAVAVRSWQDDAAFGSRVAAILRQSLPPLGTLIGVAPVAPGAGEAPLAVEEAVTRSAGGYAALFDVAAARIQIAYDAASPVVLHEAAHAWFNGGLVADRWAAEGFASYYAARAAPALKIKVAELPLTKALLARRIPLNAWASDDTLDPTVDAYGMAASLELASLIADRVGTDGLTAVWRAIEAGEMADQPAHATGAAQVDPAGASAPDWRALLDLIEMRTGKDVSDLWRTWVVRPDEVALLNRRTEVRAAYASLVAEAGDWAVPGAIRVALDRWRFDDAADLIATSRAVLAGRPALGTAAAAIGVELPTTLRSMFESDAGPAAAATELTAEGAALARLAAAIATRPVDPGVVGRVGLFGEEPDRAIDAARTAFAAGDLTGAVRTADSAATTWVGAIDVGRGRLAIVAGILTVFAVFVLLVTAGRDRRSRARWSYRAGQVIRSMGPAPRSRPGRVPLRDVGPRSGAASRDEAASRSSGVHVTTRSASHASAAWSPMAHPIEAEPRNVAAPRNAAAAAPPAVITPPAAAAPPAVVTPPSVPQRRNEVAPRGRYGTLAADRPADRSSAATPTGLAGSGGRPDAGPQREGIPPDPAPGDD